jgi:predicted nucleotidyltransferase
MELEKRLRQVAASWPEVRLAVLFGSTARAEGRPSSDVDVGLVLEPYSPAVRFRVDAQLGRAAGREVDTVLLDDAPPLLRFEVARDGVLLLEREEGLWTAFQVKAMVDWWDWAPTARKIQRAIIEDLKEQVEHGQA